MTYTPIPMTLPSSRDRAFLVAERLGIVVAGSSGDWCAARITPLRSQPLGPAAYGRTRDAAVRAL